MSGVKTHVAEEEEGELLGEASRRGGGGATKELGEAFTKAKDKAQPISTLMRPTPLRAV